MKVFKLYIKNHDGDNNAPDYEDEVEAQTIEEASKLFWHRLPGGVSVGEDDYYSPKDDWTPTMLIDYIGDITDTISN